MVKISITLTDPTGVLRLVSTVTMFSVTSQAGRATTRRTTWTIDVRATALFAIAVVCVAALLALLRQGPTDVKLSQVQGAIQDTRIVADHALQTKSGGRLTWKAEYKVVYSIAGREYAVWADSGIRGEDEDEVRMLLPKSRPSCRVRYNPQGPMESIADCR
jgi:hypothetical protein